MIEAIADERTLSARIGRCRTSPSIIPAKKAKQTVTQRCIGDAQARYSSTHLFYCKVRLNSQWVHKFFSERSPSSYLSEPGGSDSNFPRPFPIRLAVVQYVTPYG